jgi:hypothetical protein
MSVMAWSLPNNRLSSIAMVGFVGCVGAMGIRYMHRKPLDGNWLGYVHYVIDGKMVKDETPGEYLIRLNKDGSYVENSNSTSGTWSQNGDVVTLQPKRFANLTPEEHRRKGIESKGKVSKTMERLLEQRMKPMKVSYNAVTDRLVIKETNLEYQFVRME